ncbi:MAG: ribonuclease P protein component [Minisyncoccia bacterium]
MLHKKYRLSNFDFKKFFKKEKISNSIFKIYRLKSDNGLPKFSVQTNIKKSVERNKLRRRIYEILRKNLKKIPVFYYLILVDESAKKMKFNDLEERLLKLLIKWTS